MRRVLYVVFFLLPLLVVTPQLHPDELNYEAYFACVGVAYVLVLVLRGMRSDIGYVPLFLAWICVSATIYFGVGSLLSDPQSYYSVFVFPIGAFAIYHLLSTSDGNDLVLFLKMFFSLAVLQAILVILQSILSFPNFSLRPESIFIYERGYLGFLLPDVFPKLVRSGTGTFEHFNGAGALMCLGLPLSLGFWFGKRESKGRLLLVVVLFAGVFFTYSRGALLGSIIGIFFYYFCSRAENRSKLATWLILVVVVLVAMGGTQLLQEYFEETENLTPRQVVWEMAWEYATGNPQNLLLGFGFHFFSDFLESTYSGTGLRRLHSGFFQIIFELGVVGFMLFVMVFRKSIVSALKSKNAIACSLVAGVVAFLSHEFVDNSLFGYNGMLLFSFIAMSENILSGEGGEPIKRWWYAVD